MANHIKSDITVRTLRKVIKANSEKPLICVTMQESKENITEQINYHWHILYEFNVLVSVN